MIFHLAIPSQDLHESAYFYENLGATVGRAYDTHLVLDFFGHQLVCHLSDEIEPIAKMYPRHFGIIFSNENEFFDFYQRAKIYSPEHIWEKLFLRGLGRPEEHHSFFMDDPSKNIIEFKWYKNSEAILK